MKKIKSTAIALILVVLASSSANAQWVFVARKAMGVINKMASDSSDVATVLLQAKADNVYKTAVTTIGAKPNLQILQKDDKARTIAFTNGERSAKMKISPIDENITQILVSSGAPGGKTDATPLVVGGILRVCEEMKVNCTLAKD